MSCVFHVSDSLEALKCEKPSFGSFLVTDAPTFTKSCRLTSRMVERDNFLVHYVYRMGFGCCCIYAMYTPVAGIYASLGCLCCYTGTRQPGSTGVVGLLSGRFCIVYHSKT